MEKGIEIYIKGEKHRVDLNKISPTTTLNEYLRNKLFLTGTKRMCNEGGCGACLIAVIKRNTSKITAVNSCLVPILSCDEWQIDTIEGIGNSLTKYHPAQQALANFNGTQCGFCSPGMVMNMYALLENGKPTMKEVENSFGGNICRCTGYRPILTAFKSLSSDATPDLLGKYPDIEDVVCDSETRIRCTRSNSCTGNNPIKLNFEKAMWVKVFTLKDLLENLGKLPNENYMLVAGNSAKGVYKLPTPKHYIDIIEVKELTEHQIKGNKLILGGNMSLTETMLLFYEMSEKNPQFEYLRTMADHIDVIANVPVRNTGSLAGNLMMKHFHHEFPSDVFLILETFGAKLVIVDARGQEVTKSLTEFLAFDMNKKVIKSIQLPCLSKEYKYETYKIMPRAQNAHALVNAGFLFKLNSSNIVEAATVVFGNINHEFIHASNTENYLLGKDLFNNETLQGACKSLDDELKPDYVLPEPDPEFRKQLAIALFFKAIVHVAPENKLSFSVKSAASKLVRPVSTGVQDYETNESLYPLTKPIPKLEALAQTSGQAQYIEDIPDHPHQLYGKLILAQAAPNSKISKIDATKALKLEGVENFFTKEDIPGDNNFFPSENGFMKHSEEKIFADDLIEYFHQPVGILIASNRNILEYASELIEITYQPPSKNPLLHIDDVIKSSDATKLIKENEIKSKKKGKNIEKTFSGTFELGAQYHFHMETQCCLVIPTEDGLDMFTSTQWMDLNQIATAKMLKIPQNKINITVRRCGGAFGAKISRNSQISCATALAAWLTRKPVRISLSLKENMEMIGKRFPFKSFYDVDVNSLGVIQNLNAKFYSDHGVGGNEWTNCYLIYSMAQANYISDYFNIEYFRVKTDTPANTWARAPGFTESHAFFESLMDHIAYELNLDPLEVRKNNIHPDQKELLEFIKDIEEWGEITRRKLDILQFNRENRWKKKGISVVPMIYNFFPYGNINVTVSIFHSDGSVTITHGGIEIGQGINTKAAQVCAHKFNIAVEKINVSPSNTISNANSGATAASLTSEAVCYGVIRACDELLDRLKPFKKQEQTWDELIKEARKKYTILTANSQYSPLDPSIKPYKVYGVCATEVEVDILTGQHLITRVDLIEDVGTSLNPNIDIGQVEGAFIMGLGYFTTEKVVFDPKTGRLLTNNTWTYKPPGAKDIPVDFRVKFPRNKLNPDGVLNSKAVGEPAVCLSVSIPLAIRNAISSARRDASSESKYFFFDGPTSVENSFMNTLNKYEQYICYEADCSDVT